MKRFFAAILLVLAPVLAFAEITVTSEVKTSDESRIFLFGVQNTDPKEAAGEAAQLDDELRLMMISGAIDMRLEQPRARHLFDNAAAGGSASLFQTAYTYWDDQIASLALIWEGIQPDGRKGSCPYSVAIDLHTGMELTFGQLFSDEAGAVEAMEAIIQRDYLEDMNAYIEVCELLPMPVDCFGFDETGLTVYYDDSRYCTFDGRSGYVTFYWYEIAPYIGEESPVYALSRQSGADPQAILGTEGFFGEHSALGVFEPLGNAMEAYGLTDEPDYTASTIIYPLEDPGLRGVCVEIPKYAETDAEDTPICAVRHARASWNGLTTGETTRQEIVSLLGETKQTLVYDDDDAYDMIICTGESLIYTGENVVIELHLDDEGVLDTIILRDALPQMLL